ncbi:MAG: reverse transcriptase family protein, partial [Sedimenticola sp.]
MKLCKQIWWEWRQAGEPAGAQHPLNQRRKQAKRNLRKEQRQEVARSRNIALQQIMDAEPNPKIFHALIRTQRKCSSSSTKTLVVNGTTLQYDEDIVEGWATHLGNLAKPSDNKKFDDDYIRGVESDILHIEEICRGTNTPIRPCSEMEVLKAIRRLHTNKAADCFGITSEHFKFGGTPLNLFVKNFINHVFETGKVPSFIKLGIVTPVYKKGDPTNPSNYRGITVTPVLLKILEQVLNNRHTRILDSNQSSLQKGFTPGMSSLNAAIILTECIKEAKHCKQQLIVTTLDAQKAFDVVNHQSLLNKLYRDGIEGMDWMLLKDGYSDQNSMVKWKGLTSSTFELHQGVRQGGVLSTSHYKRYNNPLLLELQRKYVGAKIGPIQIPHVTCADDVALLSHSTLEMQEMLYCVEGYAQRERYCINPTKSSVLTFNKPSDFLYSLDDEPIQQSQSTTHLGVHRNLKQTVDAQRICNIGRRTCYSLMGPGFHSKTGLRQDQKGYIWTTYVLPRMLYGLEVQDLRKKDINTLEQFQRKSLKQVQGLPDRVANPIALSLLGILPISTQIEKNVLNLFYGIISQPNTIDYEIATRQLVNRQIGDNSWYSKVKLLLHKYRLPTPYMLLEDTPKKAQWKVLLNKSIKEHTDESWREEIATKSSLKYVDTESIEAGRPHHVYSSVRNNVFDVHRAEIKVKLLTGTYTLQSNRAAFNQYSVDPTCQLCKHAPETRQHFLAECVTLEPFRAPYISNLRTIITSVDTQNIMLES